MRAASRQLAEAVDRAVRARLRQSQLGERRCSGCGMPLLDWTPGCTSCSARHYSWKTRQRNVRPPGDDIDMADLHLLYRRMPTLLHQWQTDAATEGRRAFGRRRRDEAA